jgi:hypothetical protein
MQNKNKSITLGWIDTGQVTSGFAAHITQILLHRSDMISDVIVASGPYLSNNRNRMVKGFLDGTQSEWLLSLDSDILVGLESFDTLVDAADEDKYPIMGGKYFLNIDGQIRVSAMTKLDGNHKYGKWLEDFSSYIVEDLHSTGLGYCLIHRDVFEAVRANSDSPLPWFQDYWREEVPGIQKPGWISDDIHFYNQVTSLGINVSMCLGATSSHIKDSLLNEESFLSFNKFKRYEDSNTPIHNYGEQKRDIWRVFSKKSKA